MSAVTSYARISLVIKSIHHEPHTALMICNSLSVTSRDVLDSSTSRMASIPWAETSCDCISGVSCMMLSYMDIRSVHHIQCSKTTHQLVASVPELEVGRGRSELVDELRDRIAQPCIFVALQVGLEVFLCIAFVDLRHASVHVVRASRQRSPTSAKGSSSSSSSPNYSSS